MLDRLIRHGKETIAAADRDAVITYGRPDEYEPGASSPDTATLGGELPEARAELEQQALQAADTAAKTLSQVALWAVVALALEALPQLIGGAVDSTRPRCRRGQGNIRRKRTQGFCTPEAPFPWQYWSSSGAGGPGLFGSIFV
jgi:hypothetical protein